jgi:hypothetical protein
VSAFLENLRRKKIEQIGYLVTLDPGETTGWAFFVGGLLVAAGYTKSPWDVLDEMPREARDPKTVLIELPQYRSRGGKMNVTSIITLAVRVGELLHMWRARVAPDGRVELVWPTSWKGSTPKKIHNQRVLEALTKEELAVLPKRPRAKDYDHNCLDAVGMGLNKLGRM